MSFLAAAFGSLMQMMLPMQLTDREMMYAGPRDMARDKAQV
jgi:hypothetical protein